MKKLLYISVFFSVFLFSCGDDDVDVFPNTTLNDSAEEFEVLTLGGNNNFVFVKSDEGQTATFDVLIYASAAPKSEAINYTYEVVSSMPEDVAGKLELDLSGSIASGTLVDTSAVTINLDDFPEAEPQTVTFKLASSDLPVTRSNEVTFTFTIICPSDLAGTYDATTTGQSTDGCCPNETTVTKTIVIDGADGSYTVSDFTGGLYLVWYGPDGGNYGITEDSDLTRTIVDVCDNISGSFSDFFNGSEIAVTGTLDPATGIITYTWVNGFGDQGTVTLTPQ